MISTALVITLLSLFFAILVLWQKRYYEKIIKSLSSHPPVAKPENEYSQAEEDAVEHLHSLASHGIAAEHQDWNDIHCLFQRHYPLFMEHLLTLDEKLNRENTNICILIKLGFQPQEIANLMGLSPTNRKHPRARMLRKMFKTEGSAQDFDKEIMNL